MSTFCQTTPAFKVFQNTNGVFGVFLLKNNRAIEDLGFINRVVLDFGGNESVDTDTAPPGTVWWTDQGEYYDQTADILNFKLGNIGMSDGLKENSRLIVYDAVNIDGIVYSDNMDIEFIPALT